MKLLAEDHRVVALEEKWERRVSHGKK